MTLCGTATETTKKACSGKCSSRPCSSGPKTWVLAACEEHISLFELAHTPTPSLRMAPLIADIYDAQGSLVMQEQCALLDALVMIGNPPDIQWLHRALPAHITRHVVAEITYPLTLESFSAHASPPLGALLEPLFAA